MRCGLVQQVRTLCRGQEPALGSGEAVLIDFGLGERDLARLLAGEHVEEVAEVGAPARAPRNPGPDGPPPLRPARPAARVPAEVHDFRSEKSALASAALATPCSPASWGPRFRREHGLSEPPSRRQPLDARSALGLAAEFG